MTIFYAHPKDLLIKGILMTHTGLEQLENTPVGKEELNIIAGNFFVDSNALLVEDIDGDLFIVPRPVLDRFNIDYRYMSNISIYERLNFKNRLVDNKYVK